MPGVGVGLPYLLEYARGMQNSPEFIPSFEDNIRASDASVVREQRERGRVRMLVGGSVVLVLELLFLGWSYVSYAFQ